MTEIDLSQSRIQWIQSNNGNVPFGAIQGGQTSNGEPLYIGRVWHNGEPCCGKIQPSHGTLYIPYGGKEYTYKQGYEILVFRNRYIYIFLNSTRLKEILVSSILKKKSP